LRTVLKERLEGNPKFTEYVTCTYLIFKFQILQLKKVSIYTCIMLESVRLVLVFFLNIF